MNAEREPVAPVVSVRLSTIIHSIQSRPLCAGGWSADSRDGRVTLHLFGSQSPDWRQGALQVVHELLEALVCAANNHTDADIDAFDIAHIDTPPTITHDAHSFAASVETFLALRLHVDLADYSRHVESDYRQLVLPLEVSGGDHAFRLPLTLTGA